MLVTILIKILSKTSARKKNTNLCKKKKLPVKRNILPVKKYKNCAREKKKVCVKKTEKSVREKHFPPVKKSKKPKKMVFTGTFFFTGKKKNTATPPKFR